MICKRCNGTIEDEPKLLPDKYDKVVNFYHKDCYEKEIKGE